MKHPRRAIVLCAGFGQRLAPLTYTTPKPLMPFWGVPNLTHILQTLQGWGVHDVLLNLHHVPEPLFHFARSNPVPGLRIDLSYEANILGTGGALQRAKWFIQDDPTWLVNADILMDLAPDPMIRALDRPKTMAVLWVDDRSGPRTVECPGGCVDTFSSPQAGRAGTYTFCGVQILRPELLHYLPESGFSSVVEGYKSAMQDGHIIRTHVDPRSHWCDLGTPEGYLAGHAEVWRARRQTRGAGRMLPRAQAMRRRELREQGATLKGMVSLGQGCRAAAGAELENVVLLDGVKVGKNARVHDAIVGHDVPAGATVTRLLTDLGPSPSPAVLQSLRALSWTSTKVSAEHLAPRGSARSFTRLRRGQASAILVEYDPQRIENTRYAGHAQFLKQHGIRVPAVILDRPEQSFTLYEDLGACSLAETLAQTSGRDRWAAYAPVVEALAHWHRTLNPETVSDLSLEPRFDADLYAWEHELFCKHYLEESLACTPEQLRRVRDELGGLTTALLAHPSCLVHRDLQSTNVYLMGSAKTAQVAFIDFQGMRLGSPFYDLASLLSDPYVSMPRQAQQQWVQRYVELCGVAVADPLRDYWTATAQRVVQAIGAFARNARSPATAYFAQHIPAALHMLRRALVQLDNSPHLKDLIDAQIAHPQGAKISST